MKVLCGYTWKEKETGSTRGPCRKRVKTTGLRCTFHAQRGAKAISEGRGPFVPRRWQDAYRRGLTDPLAQRSLRGEIAMVAARQEEVLRRGEHGESGTTWRAAREIGQALAGRLADLESASLGGDAQAAGRIAKEILVRVKGELLPLIEKGASSDDVWREYEGLIGVKAHLLPIQQQLDMVIPVEVLAALTARFASLAAEYVRDPVDSQRFQRALLLEESPLVPRLIEAGEIVLEES